MRSHIIAHRATTKFFLSSFIFRNEIERKDFQEVARLAWAHAARLQQLLQSLLTANVSNKSGNLKDKPAAECLRCSVKQGTKYALAWDHSRRERHSC